MRELAKVGKNANMGISISTMGSISENLTLSLSKNLKMKKLITLILCLSSLGSMAQIDWGPSFFRAFYCGFDSVCGAVRLHPENPDNLWQIGVPQKTVFDSAYSPYKALLTDTIHPYSKGNYSYFDVIYVSEYFNPVLSFYHRWDMDSLSEGGWIDISYDKGASWTNVRNDNESFWWVNSENLYADTDTLNNGSPAFTGKSHGWVKTQIQWIWFIGVKGGPIPNYGDTILWRFNFISDTVETHKDGWMIDDLEVFNVSPWGDVAEYQKGSALKISPNPATDELYLSNPGGDELRAEIYTGDGRLVMNSATLDGTRPHLDVSALRAGVYRLVVYYSDGSVAQSGFVKCDAY